MSNLSFQGIQISGGDQPALDVSGHNSLHIDMWSATDGHVDLFLVSGDWPNNAETSVKLEVSAGSWNSFNIDLGAYADAVDLTNVTQMKFDKGDSGLSEFYIDNLLFVARNQTTRCRYRVRWSRATRSMSRSIPAPTRRRSVAQRSSTP